MKFGERRLKGFSQCFYLLRTAQEQISVLGSLLKHTVSWLLLVSWYCSGMRPVSGGLKVMTEANRKAEFHTHCVHSSTTATFIFNIFVYFYHSLPHCLFISSVLELLLTLMESALPISLDHHESIKMWSASAWKVQDGRTVRVFQFGESFDWSNGFCVSVCVCVISWHSDI